MLQLIGCKQQNVPMCWTSTSSVALIIVKSKGDGIKQETGTWKL